jgi:hypothetical protein
MSQDNNSIQVSQVEPIIATTKTPQTELPIIRALSSKTHAAKNRNLRLPPPSYGRFYRCKELLGKPSNESTLEILTAVTELVLAGKLVPVHQSENPNSHYWIWLKIRREWFPEIKVPERNRVRGKFRKLQISRSQRNRMDTFEKVGKEWFPTHTQVPDSRIKDSQRNHAASTSLPKLEQLTKLPKLHRPRKPHKNEGTKTEAKTENQSVNRVVKQVVPDRRVMKGGISKGMINLLVAFIAFAGTYMSAAQGVLGLDRLSFAGIIGAVAYVGYHHFFLRRTSFRTVIRELPDGME